MEKVRQSMRPKHQVLILKCYPKFQKNVADIKPNSSELSYLLYYASTRRSKVQKVGAFLEKKTASDVYKGRTGYIGFGPITVLETSTDQSIVMSRLPYVYLPHSSRRPQEIFLYMHHMFYESCEMCSSPTISPWWKTACRHSMLFVRIRK